MQRVLGLTVLFVFTMAGLIPAEEPILVIDPHGHSARITQVLFTPDGQTLISTSLDKTIRLWDASTGDLIKTLRTQIGAGHSGEILAAALSPDGKTLAVGGEYWDHPDGTPVYLFDLDSGAITGVRDGHPDIISAVQFSADGRWLASSSDTMIRIWKMTTRSNTPVALIESESSVIDLAFAPDAKKIVSAHADGALRLWDLAAALQPAQSETPPTLTTPLRVMQQHTNVAGCVDYAPNGKYIASGDFDGTFILWEAASGKVKYRSEPLDGSGVVRFAPDSKTVALGNGNRAEIYRVPDGKLLRQFEAHVGPVENTAFSNNVTAAAFFGNDLIATAGGNDYAIYLWNVKNGEIQTRIAGQGKRVEAVAFADNGMIAFGNTSGGLHDAGPLERAFDLAEMTLIHKLPPNQKFLPPQMTFQDKTLNYTFGNWYELPIQGGGTITNSPSDGWVRAYTFTPDGDVVVGSSHVLRLHQADGTPIREFVGHNGEIWSVSVSQDGALLASASDDQTIRIWNLATGDCLATLFIAHDREWVCWTPQGYYAASAGGEKYIGWQINQGVATAAQYYPVSVFRKQFYVPEMVKQALFLESAERTPDAAEMMPVPVEAPVLPPVVRWLAPDRNGLETTDSTLRIQAEIESERDVTDVKVLVNGRAASTGRGLALQDDSVELPGRRLDRQITLVPGENRITIYAANSSAGAASEERLVIYRSEAPHPNLYLISVGVSQYARSGLTLQYADDDAKAISQLFSGQQGRLYRQVWLKELYDQDATQANIRAAIAWLQQQTTQQDVVMLFVAAHGVNVEGKYYLLPADSDPENLPQTGVSWNDFASVLGNLPSRVLLLIDTCHSGQIGQDVYALRKQVDNTEALRELASDEYGVVILAASTGQEFSLEHPDWGHGAFTKALLEALQDGHADYSGNGVIDLRELDLYVAERVEDLTQGEQHPTTQKPSTISRFPIVQLKD